MSRQSGFGIEMSMVILTAYLHQGLDGEVHPSWYCWTFQQHIIDMVLVWSDWLKWSLGALFLDASTSSCLTSPRRWFWETSAWEPDLQYGVPRVYPFPRVFNIYMELLRQIIQEFGVGWHQYVDDAQLFFSMLPTLKIQWKSWAACLYAIRDWMEANKLKF